MALLMFLRKKSSIWVGVGDGLLRRISTGVEGTRAEVDSSSMEGGYSRQTWKWVGRGCRPSKSLGG